MMTQRLRFLRCVFVIPGCLLFAHHAGAQAVFQISSEPRPAQFTQSDPVVFAKPGGRFLVAWKDDRDGAPGYYAQYFDEDGSRVGHNFSILSNEAVAFGPDDEFLVVGHKNEGLPPLDFYTAYGELYRASQSLSEPFQINPFNVPADFVGCPAFGISLGASFHGYLLGDAFNGESVVREYDFDANQLYAAPDSVIPEYPLGFATAITPDGRHALFWTDATGLHGRFFNPDHEVIAGNVFLGNRWDPCEQGYSMRALALSDSLYQIFFTSGNSLWFITCTHTGGIRTPAQSVTVPRPAEVPDNARSHRARFGISNEVEKVFTVFLTQTYWWSDQGVWRTLHQTRKQDFSAEGQPTGDSLVGPTRFGPVRNFRKLDTHTFQVPLVLNDDIYLYTLAGLTLADSVKVNDDSLGANQQHPVAIAAPEGRFLLLWEDKLGRRARVIDGSGRPLGEEFPPAFQTGWYFPDGEFLTLWREKKESGLSLGYRIFSPDWQVTAEEPLIQRGAISPFWLKATAVVLDEDLFVTLLQDSTELHLVKVSKSLGILADSLIAQEENPVPLKVSSDVHGLIWAAWQASPLETSVTGFKNDFQKVSPTRTLNDLFNGQIAFLGQGRLAYVARVQYVSDGELGYHLVFRDIFGDQAPRRFKFASLSASDVHLQLLDQDHVLVTWELDKTVWSQTFDRQGNTLAEPISVYTSPSLGPLHAVSRVNVDRVLFAWSDALIEGHGLDIFGLILPASKLITSVEGRTEVPQTFVLHQNYPNPFNPETTIEYELAHPGHVRLAIYNVRGQRVRTLVDGEQLAGGHKITWDGTSEQGQKVATGVYVVELKVGHKGMRRKMVLLE
ncbi:T9SS C-terminal target domain-containing protein [Candidatus Parcubacteria bacterium]|nr:MAG: T9SS C-terminal target domain-containing protein [Candidatus Parcubacteria bacterium]